MIGKESYLKRCASAFLRLFPKISDKNYYINSQQYYSFLDQNKFTYQNKSIQGHSINEIFKPSEKTTCIIGGGVMGLTSALYLCENTQDNVVLVESLPEVSKGTSNANGGIFGVEYNIIWVSKQIPNHFWNSLVKRDYPFKFRFNALLERYMLRWIFNMFYFISNEDQNLDKLDNLAQLSGKEFKSFRKKIPKQEYDVTAKGLLSLYQDHKEFEKKSDFFEKKRSKGFTLVDVEKREITKLEPLLKNSQEKFVKGVYYPVETNFETEKFDLAILKYLKEKYPTRFHLLTETKAEGFLLKADSANRQVLGVNTNNGVIKFEKIVVAAGLRSTEVLEQLDVKCLLAPVKGYTLSVPVKNFHKNLKTIVSDEKKRMSFAQIGDVIRIAAFAEFNGRDVEIDEKRKKQIVELLEQKIGYFPENERRFWVGLRPVSPDDVPYIGKIKKYENVYINTGAGSKGSTLALGAARLLIESMLCPSESSLPLKDYEIERII